MHWLVEEKLKFYSILIYIDVYMTAWCARFVFEIIISFRYAINTHLRSFTKFPSIWLYIKLSRVKSCRQIFLFKFTFANYLLCNEPYIILHGYLCSSKLFRVLLLILPLSFQRHIYDVIGRSNCLNILMAKTIHLWTIRGLQGT